MASLAMLLWAHTATATTITLTWLGAEISFTHPDNVAYGESFDVSFAIDSSTVAPGNTLAFETSLGMSDTVDATGALWEYAFTSDDAFWNVSTSGVLGDALTPTTHDATGYATRLLDPYNGQYTWLWSSYNDRVVWTLQGLVLLDDTRFALTLGLYLGAPETFSFDLVGSTGTVPEPSPATLVALGLAILAAARRSRVRARPLRPAA
jgi:hypothetical protein